MYTAKIQVCPDYDKNLLFALVQKWQFLSLVLACLKPNWMSAIHSRDSKTCSSTLEKAVTIGIGLYLLTSAGSFDLHFSSSMITTCIRELVAYLSAYNRKGILTSWSAVARMQTYRLQMESHHLTLWSAVARMQTYRLQMESHQNPLPTA